jgi:5-methylcytosine-specific restriction endonuclease McrA
VVCKNGRPQLRQDEDRRLFAESAGTCVLCNTPLFADVASTDRSISIAERAHIVAHSASGPRGDSSVASDDLSDPANIVLLCPTCHTTVDKVPDAYPPSLLLAKKATRAAAVARVGGTPIFDTREQARRAVENVLQRNETIFRTFGPDPLDGAMASTEAAAKWSRVVLDEIVPGNELIVAMVQVNPDLATPADAAAAELLRLHTQDLAAKHRGQEMTGPALRFPAAAVKIFVENS